MTASVDIGHRAPPASAGVSHLAPALAGGMGLARALMATPAVAQAVVRVALSTPATQRDTFALLRAVAPRLTLPFNLIACYEGEGTLVLTRDADVRAVLAREADFTVVYGPRMRELTGGRDFFLGVPDGPAYRRDTGAMRRIVEPADLDGVIAMARREAAAAIAGATAATGAHQPVAFDLVPALSARIPALMVQQYFGVAAPVAQLVPDATMMFLFLFSDLEANPKVRDAALAAAGRTNAAIAASMPTAGPDTLLGRAVAAGAAGDPAFDHDGILANMLGIVIGAIPTLSKAACLAVEELLCRPEALARARGAARAGREQAVAGYVWEALRFSPVNPFIYRRAAFDTMLGDTPVPRGRMLLAANLSAMHDSARVAQPEAFRSRRPWADYMLWGDGLHRCWGDHINRAILPAMLMPLLARPGLAQQSPPDGGGLPFPRSYPLCV